MSRLLSAYCEHAWPINGTKWFVSSSYLFLRNSRQQRLESNAHIERINKTCTCSDVNLTSTVVRYCSETRYQADISFFAAILAMEDERRETGKGNEIGPCHGMRYQHVTRIRSPP